MDKYEYKLRAEEIRELVKEKRYGEALTIVELIDWNRVRGASMLTIASEVYKMNRKYDEAREVLMLAYDRHPGKRSIIFSLCELCLKMGDFIAALNYYKEFVKVATRDSRRYILQYKILESQDVSFEERIEVLEEYKKHEYRERWAYELAYLYHRAGFATKCVEECDELIVWFGEGKYVKKALELKMLHKTLTPIQKDKYDRMQAPKAKPVVSQNTDEMDIQVKTLDMSKYNTINLQEELAESMQEFIRVTADAEKENRRTESLEEAAKAIAAMQIPKVETETFFGTTNPNMATKDVENTLESTEKIEIEENELEENLEPIVEESDNRVRFEKSISEPSMDEQLNSSVFVVEGLEEAEIEHSWQNENEESEEIVEELENSNVETDDSILEEEKVAAEELEVAEEADHRSEPVNQVAKEDKDEQELDQEEQELITINSIEDGSDKDVKINEMLHQGYDGQISLVVPEEHRESEDDLQFTGQLSINDIVLEWERMKKENEEKRKEEVRKRVLDQTSDMFSEFDAATKAEIRADLKRLAAGITASDYVPDTEEQEEDLKIPDLNNYKEEPLELPPREEETAVDEESPLENETELSEITPLSEENVSIDAGMTEISSENLTENDIEDSIEVDINHEDIIQSEVEESSESIEENKDEIEVEEEICDATEDDLVAAIDSAFEEEKEELEIEESLRSEENLTIEEGELSTEDDEDDFEETEDDMYDEEEEEESLDTNAIEEEVQEPIATVQQNLETTKAFLSESDTKSFQEEVQKELVKQKTKKKEKNSQLTKEQRKMFGAFVQTNESKRQILRMIDEISLAAYTGNVIVTGEIEKRTLELSKCVIKQMQLTEDSFSGKVAKINAGVLKQKGFAKTFDRLKNGAIIVENAGMLKKIDIVALRQALQREERGILVILTDTDRAINRLIARDELILNEFNARIDITELDNDSLVSYGEEYALEKEYSIDEMGKLALYTRISDNQTCVHAVDTSEVEEIVDEAIESALRKTPKHFFQILFNSRYDDEDRIILKEDNFLSY